MIGLSRKLRRNRAVLRTLLPLLLLAPLLFLLANFPGQARPVPADAALTAIIQIAGQEHLSQVLIHGPSGGAVCQAGAACGTAAILFHSAPFVLPQARGERVVSTAPKTGGRTVRPGTRPPIG